ncbi:MAG TPA: NYN domain-containing protein [Verrucomicrobiae bacterium]|nr:NYN domain-containing protein [Verrucomicrobiae bacterium]
MTPQPRAYVYVDGFNLFYRCLRKTSLKWLNIQALSEQMLPGFDVVKVKYYTAMIRSRGDPSKSLRQETYIRALRTLPKVEVCLGLFSSQKVTRELVKPTFLTRIKKRLGLKVGMNRCVKVYDPKEKGSDVNLAVHIVNDAWQNRYDVAVLISNDSDLIEAIKVIRRIVKNRFM